MRSILIGISEDLHQAMKMQAVSQKVTVKAYVTETIRQAVAKGEKKR